MKPGMKVYVLPHVSMKFGGRWGDIDDIDPTHLLPIAVSFPDTPITYDFDYNELITEEFYNKYKDEPASCRCGADITGQFTNKCGGCVDLEEQPWQQ